MVNCAIVFVLPQIRFGDVLKTNSQLLIDIILGKIAQADQPKLKTNRLLVYSGVEGNGPLWVSTKRVYRDYQDIGGEVP